MEWEQESKKLRIIQREKRKEMEIIMRRCHDIGFKYICVPMQQEILAFGVKNDRIVQPSRIGITSFMRRVIFEDFLKDNDTEFDKSDLKLNSEDDSSAVAKLDSSNMKSSSQFASKVPRFSDAPITSSGIFKKRIKKPEKVLIEKSAIAFGCKIPRETFILKNPGPIWQLNSNPGVGVYNLSKPKKYHFQHCFGGTPY